LNIFEDILSGFDIFDGNGSAFGAESQKTKAKHCRKQHDPFHTLGPPSSVDVVLHLTFS